MNEIALQKAREAFDAVPADIREGDLFDALLWAKNTLGRQEGAGHSFHLIATKDERFRCSFAKPEWGGDHVSEPMDTAEEAIVMAVCEYLNGV